jgi:type IV fimbrial biogenesis protein FimT
LRRPVVGFTLLETVVVLAIISVSLVLAVPSYLNRASNERALNAARALASDLQVAQQEAVTRRMAVTVRFSAADAACPAGRALASYVIAAASAVIKRTCLPADVEWSPPPTTTLTFQPLGTPRAGMTMTLQSARTGRPHTVAIGAGGAVMTDDTR